jgi:hypothetical protein
MHEVSMTLYSVELLQRGVTEAVVSNRKPKGRKILEKFESTACVEVLFRKSREVLGVARGLRRDPSVSSGTWRLKPLQRRLAEATRTPGLSKAPSILRKAMACMGSLGLTVEKLKGLARLYRRVREMHELSMTL